MFPFGSSKIIQRSRADVHHEHKKHISGNTHHKNSLFLGFIALPVHNVKHSLNHINLKIYQNGNGNNQQEHQNKGHTNRIEILFYYAPCQLLVIVILKTRKQRADTVCHQKKRQEEHSGNKSGIAIGINILENVVKKEIGGLRRQQRIQKLSEFELKPIYGNVGNKNN